MYIDKFRLDGQTAVVTGACGILGRHFCAGLAEAGASIVAIDVNREQLDALEAELAKGGTRCVGYVCDVGSREQVIATIAKAIEAFGRLHILLNNAASKSSNLDRFFDTVTDYTEETWREVMSVNMDGVFWMAQAVGSHMASHGGGSIVQTASIYGAVAPDQSIYDGSFYLGRQINSPPVYSASKAGVLGLTKYLAAYWAKQGVRVNALIPGGVASGQNDEFAKRYSARVPMARMAKAEEMVGAVIYLASDASSYVTGQSIAVDGGLTAW
jgi:NAD(P)-dependent dehydrogenase (short-subunit alcohol dehydrogenase family)